MSINLSLFQSIFCHLDLLLESEKTNNVVLTYTRIAKAWHTAISVVLQEVTGAGKVNLTKLVTSSENCVRLDLAPPPFVAGFQHNFVNTWVTRILQCVYRSGSRRWTCMEKNELCLQLNGLIKVGICHRGHVTMVDAGKNPAWLLEYVRSILAIWKDGDGVATPLTIQCFKKLACCTSEAMSLICAYARVVVSADDTEYLEKTLPCIQNVVFSSTNRNGISNVSATQCINYLKVESRVLKLLLDVEGILSTIWSLIVSPRVDAETCYVLPGLPGSHVEEFCIPRVVVKKGSPEIIINCIKSALPLSLINADQTHALFVDCSPQMKSNLRAESVACLSGMVRMERFGGQSGCELSWWEKYTSLCQNVLDDLCKDFGLQNTDAVERCEDVVRSSSLVELRVRRDFFANSDVSKVVAAAALFDKVAASKSTHFQLHASSFSLFAKQGTGEKKHNPALAGRLLADLKSMVGELGLEAGIEIDLKAKLIKFLTPEGVSKMLHILIYFMTEHSKPRRKKQQSLFLKRNKSGGGQAI